MLLTIPVVWLVVVSADTTAMTSVWKTVSASPLGLIMALTAFSGAFLLRAIAWVRVLPDLSLGQSWAGVHVALAGNHVLPLRLGEPLRVVSVAHRAGIDWGRATASTITLRAADLTAIALIGVAAGIGAFPTRWAIAGMIVFGATLVVVGMAWLRRLSSTGEVALPGAVAFASTIAAWGLESVVVYTVADWVGVDLTFDGALLVTATAVVAQIAAFAPGGFGTYEAGGVAAMVSLGVDPGVGLSIVLSAHLIKTLYSLVVGSIALFAPTPGFVGQFRLRESDLALEPPSPLPRSEGPVVLFMPTYNESASIADVIGRVPSQAAGHPVECLVVDDGSADGTADMARAAGATVIEQDRNRGLGATVRLGLARSLEYSPAAVVFCDADGEYAPEEIENLVAPIFDGTGDYVVGSRFTGKIGYMSPHRRVGNLVLTWLLSWVARHRITDGQSGYRAFSPRAAAAAEVIHDFNYAQVLTLDLLAKGMTYVEVPISYHFRVEGKSFIRLGEYLRTVVPAIYREVNAA